MLVNQAGAGQGFDGNGIYLRANTGGGSVLGSTAVSARRLPQHDRVRQQPGRLPGHAPDVHGDHAALPHRRPCASNPLPDVNGAGGAGLPGDVGPPQPATVAP